VTAMWRRSAALSRVAPWGVPSPTTNLREPDRGQ
jgi:hypothetical protein